MTFGDPHSSGSECFIEPTVVMGTKEKVCDNLQKSRKKEGTRTNEKTIATTGKPNDVILNKHK